MFALIGLGAGELLIMLFVLPILMVIFGFWIWMLVDCVTNKGLTETEKIMWVLLVVFTHWIGALIYCFVGRPKRKNVAPSSTG